MDQSKKLYENIVKARRETTYLMFLFIPSLAAFFYFYQYTEHKLPLYGVIAVNVLALLLHLYKSNLEFKFKNFGIALCPSCNSVVERSQAIDKALPASCKSCGLPVKGN
jgi:hypothetical protein